MQNPTAFIMGLAMLGPALAIGAIGAAALFGMARNPQIADRLQIVMLIGFAFAEAIAIYALVIALLLKFVP